MQAANDVELGHSFRVAGSSGFIGFFQGHGVCAGSVLLASEGTEAAGGHADIGGVDMAVHIEIGHVAMEALAQVVGEPANGEDVPGAVERDRIFKAQAFAGKNLVCNGLEARVVSLKPVPGRSGRSCIHGYFHDNGSW